MNMMAQKQQVQVIARTKSVVPAVPRPCPAVGNRMMQAPASRSRTVAVHATSDNPVRSAIGGVVSGIYKMSSALSPTESGLSPLWTAIKKLDLASVTAAVSAKADLNERDANGDTPLLYIARAGHYKYPPAEIPAALIKGGADLEAKDSKGLTALQVSLLSGWQNISYLLIDSGASTAGVAAIKSRLTCPDCKRLVAQYNL